MRRGVQIWIVSISLLAFLVLCFNLKTLIKSTSDTFFMDTDLLMEDANDTAPIPPFLASDQARFYRDYEERNRSLKGTGMAFVVRTYNPTEAQQNRIVKWARDIQSHAPGIDFWISIDETDPKYETRSRLQSKMNVSGIERFFIHGFSEDQLIRTFPQLGKIPSMYGMKLTWMFFGQCIGIWWLDAEEIYEHVWMIEDDTDYSGNITEFITSYESNSADLIANGYWPISRNWPHRHRTSKPFNRFVPPKDRFYAKEHIQRFSARFLTDLVQLSRLGVMSPGEQGTPSLCLKRGFQFSDLKTEHLSNKFGWDQRVSESEFNEESGKGKLYHALKF